MGCQGIGADVAPFVRFPSLKNISLGRGLLLSQFVRAEGKLLRYKDLVSDVRAIWR